ncbi:MAG: glycosyltransferase, partial [Planctomycetes bacterium]|nr:glycosyltransferase [Planctomycetota bacterium]
MCGQHGARSRHPARAGCTASRRACDDPRARFRAPMIMDSSLVSVVIPVRNRPVLIRECVQSVVSQLYRPIEIVIVDDASSDTTPRV